MTPEQIEAFKRFPVKPMGDLFPDLNAHDRNIWLSCAEWMAEREKWLPYPENKPEKNGYYICWCGNEPGLIHYHKDTGWGNGFYNDSVTHFKILTPPKQ